MKALKPEGDVEAFRQRLLTPKARILFLDYDGTLAPFRDQRDEAIPFAGVREMLNGIHATDSTRIVFVTGRAIDDLLPLLGLDFTPEIWGGHGREHLLPDGSRTSVPIDESTRTAFLKLKDWAMDHGLMAGFEDKGTCVALHWRPFPDEKGTFVSTEGFPRMEALARESGCQLHRFDGGMELQVPGRDKGWAIRAVLGEAVTNSLCTAFLGDDLTDEDGFEAINDHGLSVLVREEYRETKASLWLSSQQEVLEFLELWKLPLKR
jgi:trehalose 6-phosphate phosphatase